MIARRAREGRGESGKRETGTEVRQRGKGGGKASRKRSGETDSSKSST